MLNIESTKMKKKEISYKEALQKIEAIVDKIENGEPDVDELATMVKTAMELLKICNEKLRSTEAALNQL